MSREQSAAAREAAIEHLDAEPLGLTADDLRCPVHGIPDCSALLNGCSIPNVIAARIRTVVGRNRMVAPRGTLTDDGERFAEALHRAMWGLNTVPGMTSGGVHKHTTDRTEYAAQREFIRRALRYAEDDTGLLPQTVATNTTNTATPEPHAYAVEVLWNPGTSREGWGWPMGLGQDPQDEREDAEADLEEMAEEGYPREHLRIVAITVVSDS